VPTYESGESTQHLINTARKKPRTFEPLVMGLASERNLKAALLDDQSEIAAANERRLNDTFTTADMYL
jgi:hypothetical protein